MKLQGKTAVITGASRGIGKSLAVALAHAGCNLLLTALEQDELDVVAGSVRERFGVSVASQVADLADESGRRTLTNWLKGREEPLDILINNAGAGWFGLFSESSWESTERTLLLDVHAPTFLIHEMLPVLRSRPEAMVVNIGSAAGSLPYPGLAVYGAAKGYLSGLSASLQCELSGTRIALLCFHPGFTTTSFISSAGMDLSRIPSFMISSPDAVAERIVRAMKRNASWVYSDWTSRLGVALASTLPHRIRIRLFRSLFWEIPEQ